jgi:hypothetical protein
VLSRKVNASDLMRGRGRPTKSTVAAAPHMSRKCLESALAASPRLIFPAGERQRSTGKF